MPKASLFTPALKAEYEQLFGSCQVHTDDIKSIDGIIARMESNRKQYEDIELATSVPWYFVAIVHNLECSGNFTKHLHNGDPLTAKTVQVPKGRPDGKPPFTWEDSAIDALLWEGLDRCEDWSIAGILFQFESYNGFGYRLHHPETKSPYLWSGSNIYVKGKYVADGHWDPNAVSKQIGAAVLMKRMSERKIISL